MDGQTALTFEDFREQESVWQVLRKRLTGDTFVHSWLLTGDEGTGKRSLADLIARFLLCESGQTEKKPCGQCPSCVQVLTGNHPDVIVIRPGFPISDVDKGKKTIPVDDIREMISRVNSYSFSGGRRVVMILQAETMTPGAQNALLRTLEDPPEGTIFLLVSASPGMLLSTIISRCCRVELHPWPDQKIRDILRNRMVPETRAAEAINSACGSIGKALRLAEDDEYWKRKDEIIRQFLDIPSRSEIAVVSAAWKEKKTECDELLDILEETIRDVTLVRFGRKEASVLSRLPEWLRKMSGSAGLSEMTGLADLIADIKEKRSSAVNWQALCEQLMLRLMEEKTKWQTSSV